MLFCFKHSISLKTCDALIPIFKYELPYFFKWPKTRRSFVHDSIIEFIISTQCVVLKC